MQQKNTWSVRRAAVANGSPDIALSATTTKWASAKSNYSSVWLGVPSSSDRVEVQFRSTANSNNGTFAIYAFRERGDAFTVCTGKAYAGTQQATEEVTAGATAYYADKINVETDGAEYWLSPILSTSEDSTADNKIATLVFKANGYKYFLVLLTAVSSGSMAVDMSHFSDA